MGSGDIPSSSATFMRKALRSSRTRLRPRSMKSSKRWVNWVMRSRRSLKPKSTEGRLSAIEGASVVYCACEAEKEAPKRLGVAGIAAIVAVVVDRWNGLVCRLREQDQLSLEYMICAVGVSVSS
jgi:hypothetical protein